MLVVCIFTGSALVAWRQGLFSTNTASEYKATGSKTPISEPKKNSNTSLSANIDNTVASAPNNNTSTQRATTSSTVTLPQATQQTAKQSGLSASDQALLDKMAEENRLRTLESCKSSKALFIDSHPVYVNQALSIHESNVQSIMSSYQSRGLGFSGLAQADVAAENARYEAQKASMETDYQNKLASYAC